MILDVILSSKEELKGKMTQEQLAENIKQLNGRIELGFFVPIGGGDMENYNELDKICFMASNFRNYNGNLVTDLMPQYPYNDYLGDIEDLGYLGYLEIIRTIHNNGSKIKFVPFFENGLILWWNLDNFKSNKEKTKEKYVEPIDSSFKEGDKHLSLDIKFRLPKGFKGDLSDAIFEFWRYTKNIKETVEYKEDSELNIYENWFKMCEETNGRTYGKVSLSKMVESESNILQWEPENDLK